MRSAHVVWAKTSYDTTTGERRWLPLWQHLGDTGAVAGHLWDAWMTPSQRSLCAEAFGGEQCARQVATFLAGTHDVGKATPAFALAAPRGSESLNDRAARHGLRIPPVLSADDRRRLPHGLAGAVALRRWLHQRHGWSLPDADQLAVVTGGHHGIPPDVSDIRYAENALGMGDESWAQVRAHLLDDAAVRSGATTFLTDLAGVEVPQPVQVLLTGLVIMADWIASNIDLFPHFGLDVEPAADRTFARARLQKGLDDLSLPAPWLPKIADDSLDRRIRNRFALPETTRARPVQHAAVAAAHEMALPGLLVIEAPMGEGKTEAALLAAEVLAQRSGAGGCFVALPTQATTDAMFRRVLTWLAQLPDDAGRVADAAHSVVLAHGRAGLNPHLRELRWSSPPTAVAQDELDDRTGDRTVLPFVHRWTSGRKKGPLADFVVGTIDQLLFTSLKARHLALRHLGVSRKVVVIDEVHAYDAYMNCYLQGALEWLGAYRVPVVLLSATLPSERRRALSAAYDRGLASPYQSLSVPTDNDGPRYPAMTFPDGDAWRTQAVEASGRRQDVRLEVSDGDLDSLAGLLRDRLRDGGCALVVRNTVRAAQETYRALCAEYEDIRLTHARFIGHDRMANDEALLRAFGPADDPGTERPHRAVVVGTQVVEQSLDVDFDMIVSDLAPVDLLLQRLGRVHRHARGTRPGPLTTPVCVVLGVPGTDAPPELDRGSRTVYGAHQLLRAAALVRQGLTQRDGVWTLPDDIAPFVEAAYVTGVDVPGAWTAAAQAAQSEHDRRLRTQEQAAAAFRLRAPDEPGEPILGWVHAGVGEADEEREGRAQVRDAPVSFEVILLRRDDSGTLHLLDGAHEAAGRQIDPTADPGAVLARALAGSTVRLPPWCAAGALGVRLLGELERTYFAAWQRNPHIGGQLVLPLNDAGVGVLQDRLAGLHISYRRDTGLEVRRDD